MARHRATHVASQAILLAHDETPFQLPELKNQVELEDMPANSTIRLVLGQLEEDGWLSREHPEGRTWYAGPCVTNE